MELDCQAFCLGAGSNPYIEQWRASPQPESELDETAQISLDVEKLIEDALLLNMDYQTEVKIVKPRGPA